MAQRSLRVHRPSDYLFSPGRDPRRRYTENRIRQIFARYARAAGLEREYARDRKGRALHELTVHALRHSHLIHYILVYKLPLPIVQKQVGHKTLKATSVYLRPSDEHVGQAYREARRYSATVTNPPQTLNSADTSSSYNDTTKQRDPDHRRPA
jgi:integrase